MRIHFRQIALAAAVLVSFSVAANAADEVKKKVEKRPPSECAGLDNSACTAKTQCSWYKEITMKNGKKRKAHCQKKSTRFKKKTT